MTRKGTDYHPVFMKTTPPRRQPEIEKRTDFLRAHNAGDELLTQLKKTNANLSIWELLMYSTEHRQAVLSELTKAAS